VIFKLSLLSVEKSTRQRNSLPSAKNKTLFAECFLLPMVFCLGLGKTFGTRQGSDKIIKRDSGGYPMSKIMMVATIRTIKGYYEGGYPW
jgi:hypothetical protein